MGACHLSELVILTTYALCQLVICGLVMLMLMQKNKQHVKLSSVLNVC